MTQPAWLAELHRQWHAARGKRLADASRPFKRDWPKLMESAGITRAEEQATAAREAGLLEQSGHLVLHRHRYRRYLIESVQLPVAQEAWLQQCFGATPGAELRDASLEIVAEFARLGHPRFPGEWGALCDALRVAFATARSLRPFRWSQPGILRRLLETTARLSGREWPVGTPVRAASVEIGLDSKRLERHQRTFEAGLARLFGTPLSFKALGLIEGDSHIELHGPVCLHFPDGTSHDFGGLSHALVSGADLARCEAISTSASRLLTIENRKTTFRQFAASNRDGLTLLATTSFPTPAFRDFLAKLPLALPHYHFGDTDPAGWRILLNLRQATPRPVVPWHMRWRPSAEPSPLTPYDRQLLPGLIASPQLADVRAELAQIAARGDRGDFEQESLGPPVLTSWPFFPHP